MTFVFPYLASFSCHNIGQVHAHIHGPCTHTWPIHAYTMCMSHFLYPLEHFSCFHFWAIANNAACLFRVLISSHLNIKELMKWRVLREVLFFHSYKCSHAVSHNDYTNLLCHQQSTRTLSQPHAPLLSLSLGFVLFCCFDNGHTCWGKVISRCILFCVFW